MKIPLPPKTSILTAWLEAMEITEVPVSYQLVTSLSAIGCVLKRNIWVDQVQWKVYPNLSVLLVGPSGIGKDTAIDSVEAVIRGCSIPVVGGATMELLYEKMSQLGDLAACYVPAPEVTAFFGSKDYQAGMVQEFTNLLSTKDYHDASTRTCKRYIKKPTLTMHAGSTEEWLHKAMPEGSLDGGLWPRFIIVYEQYGSKYISLLANLPKDEIDKAQKSKLVFIEALTYLKDHLFRQPAKLPILREAQDLYDVWYRTRFRYFSATVRAYANRSRDQVLRIAMLCAASRFRNYIDAEDVTFGINLMTYVGQCIDRAVKPPTKEEQIAREIIRILPASSSDIWKLYGKIYPRRQIVDALQYMTDSAMVRFNEKTKIYTPQN